MLLTEIGVVVAQMDETMHVTHLGLVDMGRGRLSLDRYRTSALGSWKPRVWSTTLPGLCINNIHLGLSFLPFNIVQMP